MHEDQFEKYCYYFTDNFLDFCLRSSSSLKVHFLIHLVKKKKGYLKMNFCMNKYILCILCEKL